MVLAWISLMISNVISDVWCAYWSFVCFGETPIQEALFVLNQIVLLLSYRSSLFLISTSTIMSGLIHVNAYRVSSSIQSFLTVLII